MNSILLIAHVIGSILLIGPVTLATSLFPRYAQHAPVHQREAVAGESSARSESATPVGVLLHRVTRVYGAIGLLVPAIGFALAARMGILGDAWVIASMTLTAVAAGLLALLIYPLQRQSFEAGLSAADLLRLRLASGGFAVLWAVVVALMILRPGASA
ncbi:hypothetical protein [Leucobacter sp. GX24907]